MNQHQPPSPPLQHIPDRPFITSVLRGPSKREKLRSLARATTQVIKQEINKYAQREDESLYSQGQRSIQPSMTTPLPRSDGPRVRTQSMNGIQRDDLSSSTNTVNPHCMLFPTYASQIMDANHRKKWKIRLTGWTFAKPGSGRIERWIMAAGRTYGGLSANSAEDIHFARLLNQFRCQTMRGVDIHLYIRGIMPADQALQHPSTSHRFHKLRSLAQDAIESVLINSGPTGRFEHTLTLDPSPHIESCIRDGVKKVLRLEAAFDSGLDASPHDGFVDLIGPTGISIISDIDDTIKVTGVLDGRDVILQNTFFRKANDVPGMSEVYQAWADMGAYVHYVSNSPWQVYPALSEFLRDRHFPAGSMHLRSISTGDLIRRKPGQHKLDVIPLILQDFPDRKFILVGDSGERDPEIYRMIYDQYPDQIIKIFIRDITSERARKADKRDNSDSYYNYLRKFLPREQSNIRRSDTSTSSMMEALGEVELPEHQQEIMDQSVPLKTKLDLFEERMRHVSYGLPDGVFTVFTLASQLRTDPIVARAFSQYPKIP